MGWGSNAWWDKTKTKKVVGVGLKMKKMIMNNNCWGWIRGSRGATTITKDEQKDYEERQQLFGMNKEQ